MKRFLHFTLVGFLKRYIFITLGFFLLGITGLKAQSNEVYNDANIRLRVWLHAVYTDANCSENILSGPTKFVYNKLRFRASNGTNFMMDNFPQSNLFTNFWAQDMRFRVKGNANRFWKVNDSQFRMLNPFFPFEKSTFPVNAQYIAEGTSEASPNTWSSLRQVGTQPITNPVGTYGYLLFDRNFSGNKAPDRYEWKIDDMFESDADIAGSESTMNIGGIGCKSTFGLPQYYEGKKNLLPYDPLMQLLILDSTNLVDMLLWGAGLGACINLFGWELDPTNLFNILASLIGISDYDDSYASKKAWGAYPAFFRSTSANEVGYFATPKILATENRDGSGEGYILVFAHEWEWVGPESGYPEPTGSSQIQKQLCSSEQYTDGPITLNVWLDGYFTDVDHEGTDIPLLGAVLECSDLDIGPERLVGDEEKYIRARARTQFTGMGAWNATVKNNQNKPDWINVNQNILNHTYSAAETGMNTFTYDLESWESDCWTDDPSTCNVCLFGGDPNDNCCSERAPNWLGGFCVWPPLPSILRQVSGNDLSSDRYATTSGTVNWRNSPPGVDNYVYVPIKLSTGRYESHIARLKYRWTIADPDAGTVSGPRDVILCPGETHTMTVSNSTNATWYQWQYAVVPGPAGPTCPTNATWIDVPASQGGICPDNFTTPVFTGTRVYRMLVFNRNGDGSKTPNGNKYAVDSTVCTRISILDSVRVPIDAPIACGTAASPTLVRAGSAITLRPVLPNAPGSIGIAGVRYEWASSGGTVSPTAPSSSPWETTLTFPSTSPTPVSVTMTTILTDVCPTATNLDTSCYFITEDPGCSGTTGVIYVSHLAGPGGIGTINRPYNLNDGFAAVNGDPNIKHVKILAGNYTIDSTSYGAMKLRDSLVVEGNYEERYSTELGENVWVKRSNATTNITSNIVERINNNTIHTIGFRAIGNDWVLQDVNITTGDAPNRDDLLYKWPAGRGVSNYAIHINGSTGWKILNVNAVAGQCGSGSQGDSPVENCPQAVTPAIQAANSDGYTLPGIGNNNYCFRAGGDGGVAPLGTGNPGSNFIIAPWGAGGAAGLPGNAGRTGNTGGLDGYVVLGDMTAWSYFLPKAQNFSNRGENGGGGGGGGASATYKGAAGGLGGLGGNPGFGAGASFGVWLSGNSTGDITNFTSSVTNFSAPLGGSGGAGLPGYPGGLAPAGVGAGGHGGTGGQGGTGAQGGVSGFNMSQYVQSGSSMTTVTPNYPVNRLESNYSSGCTNSKIIITKYGGAGIVWGAYPSGTLDYPDIRPGTSTTSDASANPKIIYFPTGSLGTKSLTTFAGTYQNQIYVRYERPLPTITVPSIVCYNTPVDLSSTPGMADPIDHEWVIQENIPPTGVDNNPDPVYQSTGIANPTGIILPNATLAPKYYQVRYRVRDNCCGWSIPIYDTIQVLPEINNVIGFNNDSNYICNVGDPDPITTHPSYPVPVGATWTYQWYESFNGGAFTAISPGGTSENYDPPVLSTPGTYQFMRVIGSTVAICGDTSNIFTIFITDNFTDNTIDFPIPFTAECGPIAMPSPTSSTQVSVAHANIGIMNGSVPVGPGNVNTFYYQWQKSIDTVSWVNIGAGWPSESGTIAAGVGAPSQSFDPGVLNPPMGQNYGAANLIFPQNPNLGAPGYVLFRRIVQRMAGDFVCADTSNYVASEIYPGRQFWGNCPTIPGVNNTKALCDANFPNTTALYGYTGTCMISAPDTVCPGTAVDVVLPTTLLGTRLRAEQFAWYSVPGGPYNRSAAIGNSCAYSAQCTNPLKNDYCAHKPIGANVDLVALMPYDTGGSTISVVLDSTTTFYVNAVDRCFSDADFRSAPDPEGYFSTQRWQRKTVIVVTPFTYIDSLTSTDTILCTGVTPPDSITLSIWGGDLGNDGQFVIYDTDPEVGGPHTPIFEGGHLNATATGRNVKIPIPSVPTTYYARIENRCFSSAYVTRFVDFETPSTDPDSLTGPNIACDESISLTVHGGSLGDGAQWVLYNGNPFASGVQIAANTSGVFSVTPTANTTYYVRAESSGPCPFTDTVSKYVMYSDTCVCDANPGIVEYAPNATTTIATVECEGSDGWTYYAQASAPEIYLFAIQKTPGSAPVNEATGNTVPFNAICSLTVTANPTTPSDVFYQEDLTACEANFVMTRYWNVNYVGPTPTLNGYVRIKFFFPPGELSATLSAANAWQALHNMSTCGLPLTTGPAQVFKTTDGTNFDPNTLAGHVPVVSDVLATTINDYRYIGHLLSNLPYSDTYPQLMMGKNYVQVAWDGFSGGGVAVRVSPDINVLPITLLYFTGTLVEDKVYLNWETASELNNDYFVVEKSADAVNWVDVGSVKGNGTTNIPHSYQLVDGQPYNGNNYYRLRQVDFDGTKSYSRVILIDVNNSKTIVNSFNIVPNPTAGPITATIVSDMDQHVNMSIIDAAGKLIGNKELDLAKGENSIKVDLTKYPASTYVLTYTDKSGREFSAKVVKQ